MNTQKIKVLLTALDEGSMTKAGNICGYTQSGASWLIKTFEEELGIPLLIKTNSGVEATQEAREFSFADDAEIRLSLRDSVSQLRAHPFNEVLGIAPDRIYIKYEDNTD